MKTNNKSFEVFHSAMFVGLWENASWKYSTKLLYKLFTLITIVIVYPLMLSQIIAILFITSNINQLAESLYVFLTALNSCIKCANISLRKDKYVKFMKMLLENKCIPVNKRENELCSYFNWYSRITTIGYYFLVEITVLAFVVQPLFYTDDKYKLAVRCWLPYDVNNSLNFWLTFVYQALAVHIMAIWNMSNDVIAVDFMLKICSQIHLMSYRLKTLAEFDKTKKRTMAIKESTRQFEMIVIKQCVLHHLHIYETIKAFKSTLAPIVLSQYCLSGLTVSLTIYELTVNKSNVKLLLIKVIYLIAILTELGLYCWFGNEVTSSSLRIKDIVLNGNWYQLHPRTIKCLTIVMLRASTPIFMTYGSFITISNAAYMSIIKVSFSAYSVLKNIH